MNRERELTLADTFVELADTLVDEFDVIDFFQQLCARIRQLLDVSAAAVLLAPDGEPLRSVAPCDPGEHLSELLEAAGEEGPALECHVGSPQADGQGQGDASHGADLTRVDLTLADEKWPVFGPLARRAGYTWACALPLRLRGERLGALLLLRTGTEQLSDFDVRLGQALADAAAIGLVHEQTLTSHRITAIQLRTALDSRILIEQAKGVLAAKMRVGVDEAFTVLRSHARNQGLRLTVVARAVVDDGFVPGRGKKAGQPSLAEKR
ncbi:GAF and ANTAR domain-containing protein [Streptomyces sp. NPDC004111]|uniref:GAF and ANTAR domain-containing protein n=1 Tax=Streptomyces sp. NPDC004111 TaxID=3364690 RepID=UPI0036895317